MMRRELFLCYLTFLLTAGCKQVTLGDDGFTGTWSDMGAGMQQPNGGRGGTTTGSDANDQMSEGDGDISDADYGDLGVEGESSTDAQCAVDLTPGCAAQCVDGLCEVNCPSERPVGPPRCEPADDCTDLCSHIALCAVNVCPSLDGEAYPQVFEICSESLCDEAVFLCQQSGCEILLEFARDLAPEMAELCPRR
ncbi:MAG: hypothetical protein ACON3Z_06755 [Bradymonadia bacterium]